MAGDSVTLGIGANVMLSNNTPPLASLSIEGATLQVKNWTTITATHARVILGGSLTLPAGFTAAGPSNRIPVVCSNFTLEAGSTVNADAGGYLGTQGPGAGATGERKRGGGHGGRGGIGMNGDLTGHTYGSIPLPQAPGSGGGHATLGGAGGGVVHIAATGTVLIDGTLTANGQECLGRMGGGGSGGAVLIECGTLGGSGLIAARGGQGSDLTGAGGGGRIAVHYDSCGGVWPGLRFDTAPGALGYVTTVKRFTG